MIKTVSILIRYFLFWLVFFFLERLIFVVCFIHKLRGTPTVEILKSFIIGLRMDGSMAAYVCVLPLIVALIAWFIPSLKISPKGLIWYTSFWIVTFSILCIFNFNIYREWGSKINFRALDFAFHSPNEALASGASSPIIASILTLIILIALSLFLFKKLVLFGRFPATPLIVKIASSAFLIALTFLIIRGGWQLAPINESMSYYSEVPVLNHAATNTEWALMRDILKNRSTENPYAYYTKQQASKLVQQIYTQPITASPRVLRNTKPNVILIILESFTADVVQSLGGKKGISPQTDRLASEGILFENIYASGDRTDRGIVAVLSGFPSQAIRSIMKLNSKQEQLPSLSEDFVKNGYSSSFFYGGESEFSNMKSYLVGNKFQKIIDKHAFDKKDMNSKWGAFDGVVYDKLLSASRDIKQPFFHTILSLTNHEPFELPVAPRYKGDDVESKFRSTAYYTDSCLGAFIENAKKEPWYENTLFVIVADHGHRLPKNRDINHPKRFHIPLLFFGDVIKQEFRGKRITKIGSQTDIAATMLSQLEIPSNHYKWSKDLLNPQTLDFAFFDWDNGFGVLNAKQTILFDNVGKDVVYKKVPSLPEEDKRLLRDGKAYLQQVFQQYLDY